MPRFYTAEAIADRALHRARKRFIAHFCPLPRHRSLYELLDSIEAVIEAADPAKRKALAQTIDAFAEDFPEDFFLAVGPQAPTLLHHLLSMIDAA